MNSLPPPRSAIDPLAARLERLAQRRAETTGAPTTTPTLTPAPAPAPAPASVPAAVRPGTSIPGVLAPPAPPPAGRVPQAPTSPPSGTGRTPSDRPVRSTRKHHPARVARLGALAMSCASAGGLAYLFAGLNTSQAADSTLAALPTPVATASNAATAATTATTPATSATTAATTASATAPATAPATTASTATTATTAAVPAVAAVAAYNGDIVDTKYGPVQIQVQITDGAISEVAVIQYPDGDGKSVRINARALPALRTEVLTAQSANIDTVSGATYTSDAYQQSLQSAIDQARAAGATALA